MKKITLIMIASASMIFATPAMVTGKGQGQCIKQMKKENKYCKKKYMRNNKKERNINSPFLIKQGLPHMSKMIIPYLNDPNFNLTAEQKLQLAKLRKTSMTAVEEAKTKIVALRNEIIQESQKGMSLEKLKPKVAELALLESAATLVQLKCIESTKEILTKDQLYFLFINKNKDSRSTCNQKCRKK